jgi:Flp pilus assembly protein TadD
LKLKATILFLFFCLAQFTLNGQSIAQLYESNKWEKIAIRFQQLDSLDASEQALMAYTLLRLQRLDDAETAFRKAERNGANGPKFYRQMAQLCLMQSDQLAALKALNRGLMQSPKNPDVLHDKAAILFSLEYWADAALVLEQLLKIKPYNARYTAMLGQVYIELEEPLKALKFYEAYLPKIGNTIFDRDILWDCARIARYSLNNLPLAEEYLDQLSAKFPEYWEARQELVQIYILRKKFLSAERIMERARQEFSKNTLPDSWQKSGYWMIDALRFEEHQVHVYANLNPEIGELSYKLFILDNNQQHIKGKVDINKVSVDYHLSIKTNLISETHQCKEVADYSGLRTCMRNHLSFLK